MGLRCMARRLGEPGRWRSLVDRFWSAVDSESVSPFQWLFYMAFGIGGLYDLVMRVPAAHADPHMSSVVYHMWLWLNVLAPPVALIGKGLRGNWTYVGMWMQLTGDVGVTGALMGYLAGEFAVIGLGEGNYSISMALAAIMATGMLALRDVRRLIQVERRL